MSTTANKKNTTNTAPPSGTPVDAEASLKALVASLPEDVGRRLLGYVPLTPTAEEWAAIREFTLRSTIAAGGDKMALHYKTLNVLVPYVLWVHRDGVPLESAEVFDPERVETFAALANTKPKSLGWLTGDVIRQRIGALRRVGRELNPNAPWPVKQTPHKRRSLRAPYSDAEVHALLTAIAALRKEYARKRAGLIVALGLGCGLMPNEFGAIRGMDITFGDDGVLYASIPGERARRVPIVDTFAPVILAAAEEAVDELLLPFKHARGGASKAVAGIPLSKAAPRISARRLRSTWLVDRLRAGADPRVLLTEYAGLKSVNQIIDLVRFLPEPDRRTVVAAMVKGVDRV